ncbi:MAG: hypothetical protein LBL90_09865, partial [Prevotellaceae bacterium]|nr:hypothetical protein [Prevotellaceae bacterium]
GNYTAGTGTHANYYRSGKVEFERSYKDGKKDGVEKAYYESGKPKSEVNYKDDLLDGKEIYWYETGEKEGEGNYTAGTGTYTDYYRSGKVKVERSYKDGKKDGVTKAYYESGKPEYEIAYKDDLRDGKAIYWYETGEKKGEGNYTAGAGTHANYYRSGKVEFERSYKDGKKDGVEKAYYESGEKQYEINYKNDLWDGSYILWWKGKKWNEGNFTTGTGKMIIYAPAKEAVRGEKNYKDGRLDGKSRISYSDGKPYYTADFNKGKASFKYYYNNGAIMAEGTEDNKKITGKWQAYYKTGAIMASAVLSEDKGSGNCTFFYLDGAKLFEGYYNGNKFEGECKWYYPSGTLKHSLLITATGEDPKECSEYCLILPNIIREPFTKAFWANRFVNGYALRIENKMIPFTPDVRAELVQLRKIITDGIPDFADQGHDFVGYGLDFMLTLIDSEEDQVIKLIDKLLK